jgi:hypothetical protein
MNATYRVTREFTQLRIALLHRLVVLSIAKKECSQGVFVGTVS